MTQRTQEPAAAVFGGRRFYGIEPGAMTVGQQLHYHRLYAQSGLKNLSLEDGEEPSDFAVRILNELLAAGIVLQMLGTLLLPEGKTAKDWTPAMSEETAAYLSGLTSSEDMAAVQAHVLTVVLDFFEHGLTSVFSSRKSSTGTKSRQPRPSRRASTIPSVH